MSQEVPSVVTVEYADLLNEQADIKPLIEQAFGFDGLGLIVVKGIPNVETLRQKLLPLAHKFAHLPEEIKAKYEHPQSFYSFGWSHGKESMSKGKPDLSKGSYYANPSIDVPFEDENLIREYPSFCHPNIWPEEDLPELSGAFKEIGCLLVTVGQQLAKRCDEYVASKCPTYPELRVHNIIRESRTAKGRLLYYFAQNHDQKEFQPPTEEDIGSWCGWHNDHGSLTGLVPAMYFDSEGNQIPCPDPHAGLYIRSRHGQLVKANFASDTLAFQIGETAQIHTGGVLLATPHCVRAAQVSGVSRATLAVFMEPMMFEPMTVPPEVDPALAQNGATLQYLPSGVPALGTRWSTDMNFARFSDVTMGAYYN
eukprot:TRINITY_DN963_c0_g2_i1.p1 TRINITY_DN963_c0_g2~~TRINITY_DN963_c0_g2_i1.p1  ORF type:complete len:390 (+),score=114.52 TRINITY_DN963_c0_g2_i1:72-1172(+)